MIDRLVSAGYYALITLVLLLGVLLIGVQADYISGYELRIVQSGSMEPAIPTGALIVTRLESRYAVGDVITFAGSGPRSLPTTHRIVGDGVRGGELEYITQGDANPDPDPAPVPQSAVSGRVIAAIPWLGYLIDFARQPLGFILLIIVPAAAIMLDELLTIVTTLRQRSSTTDEASAEHEHTS